MRTTIATLFFIIGRGCAYTTGMIYRLETALGASCEKELENYFTEQGCFFKKENSKMGALYEVEDKEIFVSACTRALLTFYKLKDFLSVLNKKEGTEFFALLGTLLSVERESEREETETLIKNETAVNLDGLYRFELAPMRAAWTGLAGLCDRLYSSCESADDKSSLILYLLGLREQKGASVRVAKEGLFIDGEKKRMIKFFDEEEKDLPMNIFMYRPEEMEVDAALDRSPSLEIFLRRLYRLTTNSSLTDS